MKLTQRPTWCDLLCALRIVHVYDSVFSRTIWCGVVLEAADARIDEAATRHHTHSDGGGGGGGGRRRRPAGREACAGGGREDGVGVQ